MVQLAKGPTDAYSVLYRQVNLRIDALAAEGVRSLDRTGYQACDRYKKTHFYKFHDGHNCRIYTQACPVGQKVLRK